MSQINLIIDSEDKNAVRAAFAFFETLHVAEEAAPRAEKVDFDAKTVKGVKEFVEPETVKGTKTEPVKELKEGPGITLNDLRLLVAEKAKDHKPEIRSWLTEKGFKKTPEVPTELYTEYVEFLNTLP